MVKRIKSSALLCGATSNNCSAAKRLPQFSIRNRVEKQRGYSMYIPLFFVDLKNY